jgi:hypothetical protein
VAIYPVNWSNRPPALSWESAVNLRFLQVLY